MTTTGENMTRFTKTDVEAALVAIEASAKMQGLLDWDAKLIVAPGVRRVVAVKNLTGNIEVVPAPFIPEFEPNDTTFKDMLRALTATLRVLRATESITLAAKPSGVSAGDDEDSPIYFDTFVEDDETISENPPYEQTARIIDERAGGVVAYCHVDNASQFVSALRVAAVTGN
jgi:hypothetical protein